MKVRHLPATLLLLASTPLFAANLLLENFNDISTLTGSGWAQMNNSSPIGESGWFQGNTGIFSAQAGPGDSYIAANYLNADALGGNISNWLILPELTVNNGDALTFYSRSAGNFPDNLQVRLSSNGASTNVGASDSSTGDFSSLLLEINPTLAGAGYPTDWTRYTVTLSGLGGPVDGRFAFRYFVTDTTQNGDYIGIDTVSVDTSGTVPEPSTLGLSLTSLLMIGYLAKFRFERKSR